MEAEKNLGIDEDEYFISLQMVTEISLGIYRSHLTAIAQ